MSCYGYPRLTSPYLDRLASEGTLFEDSFSPHIPTTPGYANMLTGRDVFGTDRVSLGEPGPIDTSIPTFPEILHGMGYTSVGIAMDDRLVKGFDEYMGFPGSWGAWEDRPLRKAEEMNKVALPTLRRLAKGRKPWFLFLRHMDPHAPYLPPAPYDRLFYQGDEFDPSNKSMDPVWAFGPFAEFFKSWMPPGVTDKDYIIAQYDGEVAYMDACIQHILQLVDELGLRDDTIVVVTSDHGETLYDHTVWFDHHSMYDPTLVVPMIYRWPGHVPTGRRVRGTCTLVDIVPSLLELMDCQDEIEKRGCDGKSVFRIERGEVAANYSELYITECTWMRKHGLRTPEWKLIEALEPDFHGFPKRELYNLVDDPTEYHNIAKQEPEMCRTLRNRMMAHIERREQETARPNPLKRWKLGTKLSIGSVAAAQKLQAKE